MSFNTVLGQRPIPPSFKPPDTQRLIPWCPKPTVPENSHFCQARKNYESVKKIFSRSKGLKYTSHNACICTAHFIVEKK